MFRRRLRGNTFRAGSAFAPLGALLIFVVKLMGQWLVVCLMFGCATAGDLLGKHILHLRSTVGIALGCGFGSPIITYLVVDALMARRRERLQIGVELAIEAGQFHCTFDPRGQPDVTIAIADIAQFIGNDRLTVVLRSGASVILPCRLPNNDHAALAVRLTEFLLEARQC